MTSTTKRRPKKAYTPAERAARDAADQALTDAADQSLTDPDAVAAMIGKLVGSSSPKLLRYSLRNVALLMGQADARGITLTDVDSIRGWRARGRAVRRGERALRMVAPKGTEKAKAEGDSTGEPEPAESTTVDGGEQGDKTTFRTKFRMVPVFDRAQTDGIEDFDGDPVEIEPVADPAGAVRANLLGQLERLGYTVLTTDDDQTGPAILDDFRAVVVPTDEPIEQLAQAVAALITRPADTRPRPIAAPGTATAARAAAPEPGIPLDLGEFGTGRAVAEIDHDNGRVYYRVTATNVRGCFTVAFHDPAERRQPDTVNILYGYDNGRTGATVNGNGDEKRHERPQVNGVQLVSQSSRIMLSEIEAMSWLYVRRTAAGHSERVPGRTEERTRAVVRAILRHFAALPELPTLFHRAAALAAPVLLHRHRQRADKISDQIVQLETERAAAEDHHRYYASLAAGGDIEGAQTELFSA